MCLKVGQIVMLLIKGRDMLGNGSLVKILQVEKNYVLVSTGISKWWEKPENLSNL